MGRTQSGEEHQTLIISFGACVLPSRATTTTTFPSALQTLKAFVNSRITVAGSVVTRLKSYFACESYKVSLYGYDLAIKN